MNLSANQERKDMERRRLVWKTEEGSSSGTAKGVRGGPVNREKLVVELAPMEIRTFVIELEQKLQRHHYHDVVDA